MNTEFQNEKNLYRTADLALAVAIYLFFPLKAIDRLNPRKAMFCFEQNKKLDELVEKYWHGELKVDPQAYFNALRIIKTRLYGEQ
mgnify:FL=1